MAVPAQLSEWENLQSSLIRVQNKIVIEEFSDAADDDISTPRSQLKRACMHRDDDSALMTSIRLDFFLHSPAKSPGLPPGNLWIAYNFFSRGA